MGAPVRLRHPEGNGEPVQQVGFPAQEGEGGLEALLSDRKEHLEGRPAHHLVGEGPDELQMEDALLKVQVLDPGGVGQGMRTLHLDGEFRFRALQVGQGPADLYGILDGRFPSGPPA